MILKWSALKTQVIAMVQQLDKLSANSLGWGALRVLSLTRLKLQLQSTLISSAMEVKINFMNVRNHIGTSVQSALEELYS